MTISFNRVDENYYGIDEYVKPIVEVIVKHDIFIRVLCEILNTFDTYSEHIVNDVKKVLELNGEYQIKDMDQALKDDYTLFSERVYNFYWVVVNEDFAVQLRRYDEELYYKRGLRYADKRLQRYRGILFEEVVSAMVESRFSESDFCTGCRIYIDGVRVLARYGEGNSSHKETIDIAGWNNEVCYGEFYECKINPKRFELQNYKFFVAIKNELDKNKVPHYVLALVSADAQEHLKAQKEYIEECLSPAIDFEVIGREGIFNILSYRIPEIA